MLMVKPVMAYMDILRTIKDRYPEYPMFVYQVSGEYSMIYSGANTGAFELKAVLMEILLSLRRAGLYYFIPVTIFINKELPRLSSKNYMYIFRCVLLIILLLI